MSKVLFKKGKKAFVKDLNREVTISKQRFYYILDDNKDFITEDGKIDKKELKKKDGSVVKTNQDKEFIIGIGLSGFVQKAAEHRTWFWLDGLALQIHILENS